MLLQVCKEAWTRSEIKATVRSYGLAQLLKEKHGKE